LSVIVLDHEQILGFVVDQQNLDQVSLGRHD
jgi:hypothetical protein